VRGSGAAQRNVVLVEPIDRAWTDQLQERTGMIIRIGQESARRKNSGVRMSNDGKDIDFNDNGGGMEDLIVHSIGRKIIWGDLTSLNDWGTGESDENHQLFTLVINPVSSLLQFYFGAGPDRYEKILVHLIPSLIVMLLCIYIMTG